MRLTEEEIREFLSQSFSPETKRYYRYLLGGLREWLGGRELEEGAVERYLGDKYEEESSRSTVLMVVKSFAKWKRRHTPPVGEHNLMERYKLELIEGIMPGKVTRRIERMAVPLDKLERAFRAVEGQAFAGLWCLAWFGCRPNELTALKPNAIKKGSVVFLTEKTKVERELFFDQFTGEQLRKFVGSGLGYAFLRNTCVELRPKLGMGNFTPKSLRKTFETEMQRSLKRADFHPVRLDLLVKCAMGHTTGDIAGVYTDLIDDLRAAFERYHYLKEIESRLQGDKK